MSQNKKSTHKSSLRESAEEKLLKNPPRTILPKTDDVPGIVHELEVHQTELEIQNEELRHSQQELTDSRDSFEELYDFAPVGYLTLDREGRILKANLTAEKMIGIEKNKLTRRYKFSSLVSPKNQDAWHTYRLEVLECRGKKVACELEIVKPDKSLLSVNLETICMPSQDEKNPRLMMAMIDITERKKAEEELRIKQSQLQGLFDYSNASLVLFEAKPPYRVIAHNKYYQKLWAEPYRTHGMVGKNIYDYVPEVEVQGVKQVYDEVVKTRKPINLVNFPYEGMPQGKTWWNWHLSPVIKDGEVIALAHIGIDVTEQMKAVETLKESEERFRSVLDNSTDAIYRLNLATGRYDYFSPASKAVYGKTPEEMAAINPDEIMECVHPDDRNEVKSTLARLVKEGSSSVEFRWRNDNQGYRWLSASMVLLRDANGRPLYRDGIVRDVTTRKQAEEALHQSHKTFSELIERSPFGTYVVDSRFRIAMMNTSSQTGAFRNVRPLIGRDFSEAMRVLWPEPVAAEIIGHFRHTLETGEPYYSPQFFNPRHDVETVEGYEWELHRMTLPDGQNGVICYYFDSTKLRQAEKALGESEARFRSVLDNSRDFIYRTNLQTGCYEYVSPSVKEVLGYTPDEFIALDVKKTSATVHPDDLARVLKAIKDIEDTGAGLVEYRLLNKQGEYIWVSNHLSVMKDSSGRPLYRGGSVRDITDRKQAEEALQEAYENLQVQSEELQAVNEELQSQSEELQSQSEELQSQSEELRSANQEMRIMNTVLSETRDYLDKLLNYANSPIIVWNPDMQITLLNRAFEKLTGYSTEEVIGHKLEMLFPQDNKKETLELISLTAGGEYMDTVEIPILRKDGSVRVALWNSANITTDNRILVSTIAQGQDITERKQAEEALQKTNKELEQFAYVASHDLQEPLRMVASFAQLLEKRYKHQFDKDALEYFTFIVDGAKRMQQLVEDLLQFSRIGRTETETNLIDCNEIIDKAALILKTSIEDTGAEVTHDDLPVLSANETRLIQLFQNLIGNAIKFGKKDETPRVNISAKPEGTHWLFSVKDNGMGIDPKYFEKIFVIFQRLNIRDEYSGTGIGLAICKKIVESNGGKIWVESREGEGTTFYFTIPF
jgi:PAS domain S-box-containing protein